VDSTNESTGRKYGGSEIGTRTSDGSNSPRSYQSKRSSTTRRASSRSGVNRPGSRASQQPTCESRNSCRSLDSLVASTSHASAAEVLRILPIAPPYGASVGWSRRQPVTDRAFRAVALIRRDRRTYLAEPGSAMVRKVVTYWSALASPPASAASCSASAWACSLPPWI